MTRDKIFTAGSLATAYFEISDWYGKHTDDVAAKDICFPFFGFGRITSAMCRDDTIIDTSDFLHHSGAIIDGVFTATEWKTNVDRPRFRKGHAVAGKLIRSGMDPHSAGFIDWVAEHGTPLDLASIGMAIPGQTMRGWLTKWIGNFDKLWEKFLAIREDCRQYMPMPGAWNFYEADFFDLIGTQLKSHYDVLAIDPPRLCPTKDLYSRGWRDINETLGGTVRIKPWTDRNYHVLMKRVLEIDSDYILLTWTEGHPSTEDIKNQLLEYGTLEDEAHWDLFSKSIYGWRIKRHEK